MLDELAPDGWEHSPLLACSTHPSNVERVFEEQVLMHRNLEELRRMRRRPDDVAGVVSSPEPTLDEVPREYHAEPVEQNEEVMELVGLCLWDIFSDNHE